LLPDSTLTCWKPLGHGPCLLLMVLYDPRLGAENRLLTPDYSTNALNSQVLRSQVLESE
jgi:hypothetical protein